MNYAFPLFDLASLIFLGYWFVYDVKVLVWIRRFKMYFKALIFPVFERIADDIEVF